VRDPRLDPFRWPALAFAGYLLVQAGSAAALFALKLGGGPDGVRAFYLGSEERFIAPKSLAGILEVALPHLVAIPLVLFAAIHVVGFARSVPQRVYSALVALSFGAALVGIVSGFAIRWVAPGAAWAKIAAFAGLEAALLAWAALLVALFAPARQESANAADAPESPPAQEAFR
jgi:hypothetical protein